MFFVNFLTKLILVFFGSIPNGNIGNIGKHSSRKITFLLKIVTKKNSYTLVCQNRFFVSDDSTNNKYTGGDDRDNDSDNGESSNDRADNQASNVTLLRDNVDDRLYKL